MVESFLHPLFSSDMVLQRDVAAPLWGWAEPGTAVSVAFNDQSYTTLAGPDGRWEVQIRPLAAGGPFDLRVSSPRVERTLTNVMIGDVWLCSGQSNMEMGIGAVTNARQEILHAHYPKLRLFDVPKFVAFSPQEQLNPHPAPEESHWMVCSPQTVAAGGWDGFSAVAYFFGRELVKELDVPIGLLHSSWGGTVAESWTSAEALQKRLPEFSGAIEAQRAWERLHGPPPQPDAIIPKQPAALFNGMIHPLLPLGIKGVIWYQGESNAERSEQYRALLPALISDWRSRFGVGPFPFYIVQLANFMEVLPEPADSDWAELREAQAMTSATVGHSGIATAIDLGEADDIHPKNKAEVGRRLALNALALTYGRDIVYSGPVFERLELNGARLVLHFRFAEGGLEARGGQPLKGFAVAGGDDRFVWADAKIQDQTVIVSSTRVSAPAAVRYAWAKNPVANLYNKAGLPALPFRADVPK